MTAPALEVEWFTYPGAFPSNETFPNYTGAIHAASGTVAVAAGVSGYATRPPLTGSGTSAARSGASATAAVRLPVGASVSAESSAHAEVTALRHGAVVVEMTAGASGDPTAHLFAGAQVTTSSESSADPNLVFSVYSFTGAVSDAAGWPTQRHTVAGEVHARSTVTARAVARYLISSTLIEATSGAWGRGTVFERDIDPEISPPRAHPFRVVLHYPRRMRRP